MKFDWSLWWARIPTPVKVVLVGGVVLLFFVAILLVDGMLVENFVDDTWSGSAKMAFTYLLLIIEAMSCCVVWLVCSLVRARLNKKDRYLWG